MVSVDELQVDYLGRSERGYPCLLLESGKIAMYVESCGGFFFYKAGGLIDVGEIVYSSSSGGSPSDRRDQFCIRCNSKCKGDEGTMEINLLTENIREDVCPRSMRKFLHGIFYFEGRLDQYVEVQENRLCSDCVDSVLEEFEYILDERSTKITKYTI